MKQTIKRLGHSIRAKFRVRPLVQTGDALHRWLQSPLGQALLAEEQSHVDELLRDLYGFHLLQLGISPQLDLSRTSTIHHRFSLAPTARGEAPASPGRKRLALVQADPEQIPLASETIDVGLLHHALEFTENPHQLLREAARVIIPRGYLVIVTFNPWSWLGLFKQWGRVFSRHSLWQHHSLRKGRLGDWLRLLDFEPTVVHCGFHRWPIDHPGVLAKTQWYERLAQKLHLPGGGFYIIVARKDVVALTPIKPSWKTFNPIEGLVGVRPSTRLPEPMGRGKGAATSPVDRRDD